MPLRNPSKNHVPFNLYLYCSSKRLIHQPNAIPAKNKMGQKMIPSKLKFV